MLEKKTTLRLPADLWREARAKATIEGTSLSEVMRHLLDLWVKGEVEIKDREELKVLAREAFGMWADRDPDEFLMRSRAGLMERDKEVEDARLAV